MGNNNLETKTRRGFFSLFLGKNKSASEKVKMLTPEGKLVLVDKAVLQNASSKKKAGNKEVFDWMKNPSK